MKKLINTIYRIFEILIFLIVIIPSSIIAFLGVELSNFSKKINRKISIRHINFNLKKLESKEFSTGNFDPEEFQSWHDINDNTLILLNNINNLEQTCKLIYRLSSIPMISAFLEFMLGFKFLSNQKQTIDDISNSYFDLGKIFLDKNIYTLATKCFSNAIVFNNKNAHVNYLLGLSILRGSNDKVPGGVFLYRVSRYFDFKSSLKYLKKSVKLQPHNELVLNEIGNAYRYVKKTKLAKKYYEAAISVNPNFERAYYNLGNLYAKQSMLDKSIDIYNRGLSLIENSINLENKYYANLAYVYKLKNSEQELIKCSTKLIENNVEDWSLYFEISELLFKIDEQKSMSCFESGITLFLKQIDDYLCEAYTLKKGGYSDLSDSYLDVVINNFTNIINSMSKKGGTLSEVPKEYLPIGDITKRLYFIIDYFNERK